MASNLMASDLLDIDWGRRARDILANASLQEALRNQPKQVPEIRIPVRSEPVEIREKNVFTDPNSWLNRGLENLLDVGYTSVFGEGTGNMAADLAFGLTGPGSAAATIAAGNRPGVLDVLPGGGAVKGMAVLAVPKATRVIRGVLGKSLKGDYAVDEAYRIAQEAVDEVSRYGREITVDDLKRAISERVDALGDVKGKVEISRNANDLADRTWSRAMEGMEQGNPFTLKVPEEKVMFVSNVSMDNDTGMPSRTSESHKTYRKKTEDKYADLLSRLSPEEQEALKREAYEFGETEREKALAEGKTAIQANGKAFKSRQAFTRNFLRDKFPESPKSYGEIKSVEYELPENVASAATDARQKVYDESIKSGLSEDQARMAANVAYHRVINEMAKTDPSFKQTMKGKVDTRNNNIRVVMSKIDPEVMREIDEEASLARETKKQSSLENGASRSKASSDGQSAYNSLRQRKVNEFIKSLGFKSFNDLRMNQYSQLRRDGNHVLATPTEQVLMAEPNMTPFRPEPAMAEAATPVKDYDVTPSKILGTTPSRRLLPEDEFSDADITDLLREYGETPTADAAFNREYAEELMREAGY